MKTRLGIIGCGQLGQMLGHAAQRLGLEVCFLCIDEASVVDGLGPVFTSREISTFLTDSDCVTVEREAIPEEILLQVEQAGKLVPGFAALKQLRHRHTQKALLDQLNIPTAAWRFVNTAEEIGAALTNFAETHVRCKQTIGGYDGGGQWRISTDESPVNIPENRFPLIMESEITVERELSILLARSASGSVVCYPITENHMRDGILTWSFAPALLDETRAEQMRDYGTRLVEAVDYVGVMAIEFFESDGRLMVNEIAPRVHNTGHWTLNACDCDQFEQHVRAVAGRPLLDPGQREAAAMRNLIGDQLPRAHPPSPVRMYLQSYGKTVRPGRKVGHLTLVAPDMDAVLAAAREIGMP